MIADDFMALEPLLVARLELALASDSVYVLTAPDLAYVAEEGQLAPAVHVVYGGHRMVQQQVSGRAVIIEQDWYTVVTVRNVQDHHGADARGDAGPLLSTVFAALAGWTPAGSMDSLQAAASPMPGYTDGYGYFPLAWTYRALIRAIDISPPPPPPENEGE